MEREGAGVRDESAEEGGRKGRHSAREANDRTEEPNFQALALVTLHVDSRCDVNLLTS